MPEFIVIEGLDGVGKSTAAALIEERLGAVNPLREVISDLATTSRLVDSCRSPRARFFFWLGVNELVSDRSHSAVAEGRHVVVDSYVFRTLASHACLGVQEAASIDLFAFCEPTRAVFLNLSEVTRVNRVRSRHGVLDRHRWDYEIRNHRNAVLSLYRDLGLAEINVDHKNPLETTDAILGATAFTWPRRFMVVANGTGQ